MSLCRCACLGWRRGGGGGGGGGHGRKCRYNSTTINDIDIEIAGLVENHKLINLVWFKWHVKSSLCYKGFIIVKILAGFLKKSCLSKVEKFRGFLLTNDK